MKTICKFAFFLYVFFFALDYCSLRLHSDDMKPFCTKWMQIMPWWGHLAMPGPANACIDRGDWP